MTPFELAEPATLEEALQLLDPDDASVRPLGGGTALMLMMKAGVFAPRRLVSLRKISALKRIAVATDGGTVKPRSKLLRIATAGPDPRSLKMWSRAPATRTDRRMPAAGRTRPERAGSSAIPTRC